MFVEGLSGPGPIGTLTAQAPNHQWATDVSYCRTWARFVYVAFVICCFSRVIVDWHT